MKQLNKIAFNYGTMQKLTAEYYTLALFNAAGKRVYIGDIPAKDAAQLIDKHDNIKLIK